MIAVILATKETFLVYLGSVHKYFGGGAGELKIFVVKLFDPPFASCQNFLNPPQQV